MLVLTSCSSSNNFESLEEPIVLLEKDKSNPEEDSIEQITEQVPTMDNSDENSLLDKSPYGRTKEECETITGCECTVRMCDVTIPGKTIQESCGKDFVKGWNPTQECTYPLYILPEHDDTSDKISALGESEAGIIIFTGIGPKFGKDFLYSGTQFDSVENAKKWVSNEKYFTDKKIINKGCFTEQRWISASSFRMYTCRVQNILLSIMYDDEPLPEKVLNEMDRLQNLVKAQEK